LRSGLVYDAATKAPTPAARVTAISVPATGGAPNAVHATSLADGTAALGIAPGRHVVCVDAGRAYLDPCRRPAGNALIDTAQSLSVDLPLTKGVLVIVRISDPTGAAEAVRQSTQALAHVPAPPVWVTVRPTSGLAMPAPFVAANGANSEFSILVPPNTPLELEVGSSVLGLADAAGKALPSNGFAASLTSPDLAAEVGPSWMFGTVSGAKTPTVVYSFVVTGLL